MSPFRPQEEEEEEEVGLWVGTTELFVCTFASSLPQTWTHPHQGVFACWKPLAA